MNAKRHEIDAKLTLNGAKLTLNRRYADPKLTLSNADRKLSG